MSMECHSNYLSLLPFKSILWCSVHKFFTSREAFVLPCLGPLETGMKRRAVEDSERPLPPLWTYSVVTCPTGTLGHALHHCLQVSTLLGIFFESECSPYYWDVHKHTPNAWPRFKSPRYTYIWLISSGHQIVHNREKPEEAISCLFLFVGARRAELSSVVATSQISLSIINIPQTIINIFLKITKNTHLFITVAIFPVCPYVLQFQLCKLEYKSYIGPVDV